MFLVKLKTVVILCNLVNISAFVTPNDVGKFFNRDFKAVAPVGIVNLFFGTGNVNAIRGKQPVLNGNKTNKRR